MKSIHNRGLLILLPLIVIMVMTHTTGYSQCTATGRPSPGTPVSPTCDGFTIQWPAVSGAASYQLDVATTSTFTAGTYVPGHENLSVTGVSYTLSGLAANTYYYRMRAVASCGPVVSINSIVRSGAVGTIGGRTVSMISETAERYVCGSSDYGRTRLLSYSGTILRWEGSYDNSTWFLLEASSANSTTITCCMTADTLRVRAVVQKTGCAEVPSEVTTYYRRSARFAYSSPYCNWNSSNNPAIKVANPKPVFMEGGIAGVFTSSPSGLVFVDNTTGEINLQASAPGSYTITNTTTGICNLVSTAPLELKAGKSFEIGEDVFNSLVPMGYYRIEESTYDPDWQDSTLYGISWWHITSTGQLREVTDISAPWQTVAKSLFSYFVNANPGTGVPRNQDALCVDVVNKITGCITRRCLGKDPNTLPAPGSNFREKGSDVVTSPAYTPEEREEVSVYPNPASQTLNIIVPPGKGPSRIQLRNLNGIVVQEMTTRESRLVMDVSQAIPGLYIIQISNGNTRTIKKVEIIR